MRRLLLLRHAKAERSQPGGRDEERPLTDRGRADAARLGAYLVRHRLVPDLALVSSAARTRETWHRAAAAFENAPPAHFEERLYGAAPEAILQVIRETAPEAATAPGDRPQPRSARSRHRTGRRRRHRGPPASQRAIPDRRAGGDRIRDRRLARPSCPGRPARAFRPAAIVGGGGLSGARGGKSA